MTWSIDGDKGILRYRGMPIEQLAEQSTFLETAHLVLYGELPTQSQLDVWVSERFFQRQIDFGVLAAKLSNARRIMPYWAITGSYDAIMHTDQKAMGAMIAQMACDFIAAAVTKSGLAQRVAYVFMTRYATSYRSLIVMTYVLGFVLSLLMMALVADIIQKARMNKADAASLGLSVFVATTATSTILLTGDSTLNIATIGFSGLSVGWLDLLKYMAIPGLVATVLMLALHLLVFRQTGPVNIDRAALRLEQQKLGPVTRREVVTLVWVLAALLLWITDFIHHIDPAWVALGVAVGLSLPVVGDVLDAKDISTGINWPIVLFVVGALAMGTVGKVTGMSDWLAATLLPAAPPQDLYALATLVGGATMLIHMVLGSALACMSISPTSTPSGDARRSGVQPGLQPLCAGLSYRGGLSAAAVADAVPFAANRYHGCDPFHLQRRVILKLSKLFRKR